VAPMVFGHHLRINPLLVIFVLLLGGHLHGIVGALVALPLAAIARETTIYLRRHLVLEPWGTPTVQQLRREQPPGDQPAADLCRRCGAPVQPDAAFCTACGMPLRVPILRPDGPVLPRHKPSTRERMGGLRGALRLRR
jgi:hypothetical protein